jgi:hypothetical protein
MPASAEKSTITFLVHTVAAKIEDDLPSVALVE